MKKKYQSPRVVALGTVKELTEDLVEKCGSSADVLTPSLNVIGEDVSNMPNNCMNGGTD
jgi:hypothetical protein